jgi:hypothetical protein
MRLVRIGNRIVNLGALADAHWIEDAHQGGSLKHPEVGKQLTVRYMAGNSSGLPLSEVFKGDEAEAVWGYLCGLCESHAPDYRRLETKAS